MTDDRPALTDEEVEVRLLAFIREELLRPEVAVDREDELLSGELLDSLGVVRLAAFVAQEFELQMKPADFVIGNFRSVAALAEFVRTAER